MIIAGVRPPWYVAPPAGETLSADADDVDVSDSGQSARSAVDIAPRRPAD